MHSSVIIQVALCVVISHAFNVLKFNKNKGVGYDPFAKVRNSNKHLHLNLFYVFVNVMNDELINIYFDLHTRGYSRSYSIFSFKAQCLNVFQ